MSDQEFDDRDDVTEVTPAAESNAVESDAVVSGTEVSAVEADGDAAAEAEEGDEEGDDEQGEADDPADEPAARTGRPTRRAALEQEGEVAADFLETLLDICDLDGDIDVDIDGDRASVSIVDSEEGRVPRRLVGTNGSVLDALQELTRLAAQSVTGERSRLMLDIAGHRAERRATLVAAAQVVIARVKENGQQQSMEPMSAFERKVVHDEVLAAGLVSESEGSEPRRYVVVHPA